MEKRRIRGHAMSTLQALESRKHELRVELVHAAKTYGRTADLTLRVYRKLAEVKRAERYLRKG
jgi:hypothetical protein